MLSKLIFLLPVVFLGGWSIPCCAEKEPVTSNMVITAGTPWVVEEGQPEAIQRALKDVARDWYKVFGRRPLVLKQVPTSWKGPVICLGSTGSWLNDLVRRKPAGKESFILRVQKDSAGRCVLVGTGADLRGSIYAAYALSEEILGVDPWYYWVDKEPVARTQIEVPVGFDRYYGSPTFTYRGWFINDEDLLSGFAPDPLQENVFSLEMFDRIYETLLRLRGNMVVPSTFAFPDERCHELAAKRGLILNMHHIFVLGLNTYRWPKDVPFSFNKHPEIMERYWQSCIEAYKDYEVVWTVGFRGKNDQPFWTDEPELKTLEQRAAVINRAIAKQVELIRKVRSEAPIIANMWMEGVDLYHQGLIKLPARVTLVWPDNGAGIIRDNGTVTAGQGIYYHTAMLDGACNQLTEMVNPGRIYNQVGRFIKAGATEYFLVNVSDIRPVPLSTDCVMKLVWNAKPYLNKTDQQNMDAFIADWSRRQFGPEVAGPISDIYLDYFATPYMSDKSLKGDNWIIRILRQLNAKAYPQISRGIPLEASIVKLTEEQLLFSREGRVYMEKLLKKAEIMFQRVPDERKDFYRSHVLTQIQVHLQGLTALEASCYCMKAYEAGDKEKAAVQAEKSLKALDRLSRELQKAEYGKWSAWHYGEIFVDIERARYMVDKIGVILKGEPEPVSAFWWDGSDYHNIYKYQEPFLKNFPLLYPNRVKVNREGKVLK